MATLALLNVTLWGWDQESESSVAALAARTQAVYRKHCLHPQQEASILPPTAAGSLPNQSFRASTSPAS